MKTINFKNKSFLKKITILFGRLKIQWNNLSIYKKPVFIIVAIPLCLILLLYILGCAIISQIIDVTKV